MLVVEGVNALDAVLVAGAEVESVFLAPAGHVRDAVRDIGRRAAEGGARVYNLADGVIERVAGTVTPQPVLAIARTPQASLNDVAGASLAVVCVDVRDPGNVGTIVRTAAAVGAGVVVCCDGTADPFSPKCVRASAGAVFQVPVVAGGEASEVLGALRARGLRLWGTRPSGGTCVWDVDLAVPGAFVVGNESTGLPEPLSGSLDEVVTIPMPGETESLNVSVTIGVLCFEAARQRRSSGTTGTEP